MNWLTNFVKPKLSALVKRKEVPENLWNNCPTCGNMIHHKDLRENLRVCISCNYHFRMSAEDRIKILFFNEKFNEIELDSINDDPLTTTITQLTQNGKHLIQTQLEHFIGRLVQLTDQQIG